MKYELTEQYLLQENECFSNTAGISKNNYSRGFQPAFRDDMTGDVYLSRFANGRCAPVHLLAGLPDEVVIQRTATGEVSAIRSSVISGFVHAGCFFTRLQVARLSAICH